MVHTVHAMVNEFVPPRPHSTGVWRTTSTRTNCEDICRIDFCHCWLRRVANSQGLSGLAPVEYSEGCENAEDLVFRFRGTVRVEWVWDSLKHWFQYRIGALFARG